MTPGRTLADEIAASLDPKTWMAWTEIFLGPVNMQRADVLAIRKSYHVNIRIFEIKMTRGDFQRDVISGKYRGYFKYCHQFFFVSAPGLIKVEDCPKDAGLASFNKEKKTLTVIKGCPVNALSQIDVPLLMKCLMRGHKLAVDTRRLTERVVWKENVELAARAKGLGYEIAKALQDPEGQRKDVVQAKEKIDRALGVESANLEEALGHLGKVVNVAVVYQRAEVLKATMRFMNDLLSTWDIGVSDYVDKRSFAELSGLLKNGPKPKRKKRPDVEDTL